jgi:hypothetical protein
MQWTPDSSRSLVATDKFIQWTVDETDIFWLDRVSSPAHATLWATTIQDASTRRVSDLDDVNDLIGQDTNNIFVQSLRTTSEPVRRIPKTGGTPVDVTGPITISFSHVAEPWLYFTEQNTQEVLERVKTTGGNVESVATVSGGGYPTLMTHDECAIYWSSPNPDRVMYRNK